MLTQQPKVPKVPRVRHNKPALTMPDRRRKGAVFLAVCGLIAVYLLRSSYDLVWLTIVESSVLLSLAVMLSRVSPTNENRSIYLYVAFAIAVGGIWCFNALSESLGYGNGNEIVVITAMAWACLLFSMTTQRARAIDLTVIGSGFLTLFVTCISDHWESLVPAAVWGWACLHWMVANHWEQIETTAVMNVRRPRILRLNSLLLGSTVFGCAAFIAAMYAPAIARLNRELMWTSGGSTYSDRTARKGVGDGEALVAARSHANSFGNVDTDIFVDSPEPSLYDLFNEQFGEPRKKKRTESTQALALDQVKEQESQLSEGKRAGSSFSTDRTESKVLPKLNDLQSNALMFWTGRSNILLAAARYEDFDGVEWHDRNTTDDPLEIENDNFEPVVLGEQTWFQVEGNARQDTQPAFVNPQSEALKFANYRTPYIPTDSSMSLWSIDQVDRADFFALRPCGILEMTDREHVPDYTVVRFVNQQRDLAGIDASLKSQSARFVDKSTGGCAWKEHLTELSQKFAADSNFGWAQVQAVVNHLRSDFKVSETLESREDDRLPIECFLEHKSGADIHFATAAALLLRELGYETRFATGYFVRPRFLGASTSECAILKEDLHAWAEVHVGNGQWIPIEPTPTYPIPYYRAGLWYRIKQAWVQILVTVVALSSITLGLYATRRFLFEVFCRLIWWPLSALNDASRIAWFIRILDMRLKLAGARRPAGAAHKSWLLQKREYTLAIQEAIGVFFQDADSVFFGRRKQMTVQGRHALKRLWHELTVNKIQRSMQT